jgi:hypothetical protein
VPAAYTCSVPACTGTVPAGSNIDTAAVGSKAFTVTATNGPTTTTRTVAYNVTYKLCLLYDPGKALKSCEAVPIQLQLCDAPDRNVSAASIVVKAANQVTLAPPGVGTYPVQDASKANPGNQFRYDPKLGKTGGYIFDFSNKALVAGTYDFGVTVVGDPVVHTVQFRVK